jgi:hypothetical protein
MRTVTMSPPIVGAHPQIHAALARQLVLFVVIRGAFGSEEVAKPHSSFVKYVTIACHHTYRRKKNGERGGDSNEPLSRGCSTPRVERSW